VVKDLKTVMENYWNILGIGPWDVIHWEAPLVYDRKYHGEPAWAREIIALTQVGGVQLELCQPVEGNSVYLDSLAEHGEGLHHLNFLVDDVDETASILAEQGFPSIQSGRFGLPKSKAAYNYIDTKPRLPKSKAAYNYIDTKPLRTIWEPVHEGEKVGGNIIRYP
jgi:hypothetical protein